MRSLSVVWFVAKGMYDVTNSTEKGGIEKKISDQLLCPIVELWCVVLLRFISTRLGGNIQTTRYLQQTTPKKSQRLLFSDITLQLKETSEFFVT
jgi:hypothetical protein